MTTYLSVCLLFGIFAGISCFKNTSPEAFPFIAFVESRYECTGFLISTQYVVAPAACIDRSEPATVHLGYSRFPHFKQNLLDPKGLTIKSFNVIFHADFLKIVDNFYLNNIVLIKLTNPVRTSENIQPGKLMSNKGIQQLQEKPVDVTGWKHYLNTDLLTTQAQIRNKDTCKYYFHNFLLENQEGCIKWVHPKSQLDILGNVISLDGSIIGFQITTPPCTVKGADCSEAGKILYISPFSDWIAQILDEPAAAITKQENDESKNRIEEILKVFEKIKSQQDAYRVRLNRGLDAIDKLEQTVKQGAQSNMFLNEKLNSFKSEVINNAAKQNESILSLEEEVASARTEVTDGLVANKLTADTLGNQLNDSKAEMAIQVVNFNEQIKNLTDGVNLKNADLQNKIFDVKSGIEHLKNDQKSHIHYIASELQSNISNLKSEVSNLHEQQSKKFTQVADHIHEQINHFDVALTNLKTEVDNLETYSNQVQSKHTEWYSNVTKELNVINEKIKKSPKDDNKTPHLEHKLDSVMEKYTALNGRIDKLCADVEKLSDKVLANFWFPPT